MNAWIWLGLTLVVILVAFGVGYRFAPKGLRTKLSNLLMVVAGGLAALTGALTNLDYSQFGSIGGYELGPIAIASIPTLMGYINKILRDVTDTPAKKLIGG